MAEKIDNPFKVPKAYWSILSNFLGKRKTASITPLIVNDLVVSDFSTKTNLLNNFFTSQGSPVVNYSTVPETDLEGGAGRVRPFFCYHLEELQTVFVEVKLIINNEPLTYFYPNTIKPYLTPNHLLFGRHLLCYTNTTSIVVRNLTVLSNTADKISGISNYFLNRWWHEYVVNLVETQRAPKVNINS